MPATADSLTPAMELALQLATAAAEHSDIPVGAVVLREGANSTEGATEDSEDRTENATHEIEIIATGKNERELLGDPTAHAEVQAIRAAAAKLGTSRLDGLTLVTTLEPCPMCAGAAAMSRIAKVVFGAHDLKNGACGSLYNFGADPRLPHNFEVAGGLLADDSQALLRKFFETRR